MESQVSDCIMQHNDRGLCGGSEPREVRVLIGRDDDYVSTTLLNEMANHHPTSIVGLNNWQFDNTRLVSYASTTDQGRRALMKYTIHSHRSMSGEKLLQVCPRGAPCHDIHAFLIKLNPKRWSGKTSASANKP